MKFENPHIEDDINVSHEHPLKEFSQLLMGSFFLIVVIAVILTVSGGFLAKKMPFSYEQKLVSHISALHVKKSPKQEALQALADKLVVAMDLPEGMQITVHYSEDDVVNAFATMGGHVFFYKGLVDQLPSEEALAMVMAHEIAHIEYRHPIASMGRGLTLMILGGFIVGASGSNAGEFLINESMVFGLLKFSRDQELQADLTAMQALNAVYGNVQGAQELFDVFSSLSRVKQPEIFSTHPHSHNRWDTLREIAQQNGWQIESDTTPLSNVFNQ